MPLYYAEDDRGLFTQINRLCDAAGQDTGTLYSVHSRVLIFNALTAILEDPSNAWKASDIDRRRQFERFSSALPGMLVEIAKAAEVKGKISYFDTMHWLSSHLDSLCPFDK
jgi:hypothetical protein